LYIAYLLCWHVLVAPAIMDQGLGEAEESYVESSSSPLPQPHETAKVSAVNEHEPLLSETGKTKSSMCLLSFTNY
jgi:hypothetical protein